MMTVAQENKQRKLKQFSRREILKVSGSALGVLLAGMPKGWIGGAYAADGPETTSIRFGIICLDRLFVDRDGSRIGLVQKIRHRIDYFQGSVLGGDSRQNNPRRKPGDPYAFRHAFFFDDGSFRFAKKTAHSSVCA